MARAKIGPLDPAIAVAVSVSGTSNGSEKQLLLTQLLLKPATLTTEALFPYTKTKSQSIARTASKLRFDFLNWFTG